MLSMAYLLANSLVSDDMLNFTLATLLKFVATGPGQNMDIFTFDLSFLVLHKWLGIGSLYSF